MAIQVIGLNPAVDVEWRVEQVNVNEKTVIESARSWAGGKPPNVARWLRFLGGEARLVMPLGGAPGELSAHEMRDHGVNLVPVQIGEETRTNVMVTPDTGKQLRFNPKGPRLTSREWKSVFAAAEQGFGQTRLTVLSGSLPRAAGVATHARLVRAGRKADVPVILDCDGAAFAAGVKAKPFLVKPNRFELSLWFGADLKGPGAIRETATSLSGATGGWVFVSLDAGGGMLVNAEEGFHAEAKAPQVRALNEVGAGDALLARVALEIERGSEPVEWLRAGIGTGTAFVQSPAGRLPKKSLIRQTIGRISVKRFS